MEMMTVLYLTHNCLVLHHNVSVPMSAADVRPGQSGTSELIFRPTDGGKVFSQLVSLCTEPAILGDKLLTALAAIADDASEHSQSGWLSRVKGHFSVALAAIADDASEPSQSALL